MQAFIHPFLARLFWSTPIVNAHEVTENTTYHLSNWSPYGYCSGTYVLDKEHNYIKFAAVEPAHGIFNLTFIDFAGSGLVHVCGKYYNYHAIKVSQCIIIIGGIGGLMLALFHKLEGRKNKCCGRHCYTARGTDTQPLNRAVYYDIIILLCHIKRP